MNRRSMLKALPLVALSGATVQIGNTEAKAFEMKADKKYLFVMPDAPTESARQAAIKLRERGINATVVAGASELKIYELG